MDAAVIEVIAVAAVAAADAGNNPDRQHLRRMSDLIAGLNGKVCTILHSPYPDVH